MLANVIHPKLMLHGVKRFWPLWLAFFAAWTFGLLVPLFIFAPWVSSESVGDIVNAMDWGWQVEYAASLIGSAIASLVTVLMVFDQLFARGPAVFYGSVPVSRKALFATQYVAGLLPLLFVELVVFAILACMSVAYPAVQFERCMTWLELTVVFTLVNYATAVLCSVLAGTRSMAVVLFGLAAVLGTAMEFLLKIIADSMVWGVSMPMDLPLAWLSPITGLAAYVVPTSIPLVMDNHLAAAVYVVVSVAVALLCGVIYCFRNLEVAGAPLAEPRVAPLLKVLIAAFVMVIFTFFALLAPIASTGTSAADPAVVAGTMVLGALVGCLVAQGAATRSTRNLGAGLKYGALLAVLSVAFVAGCAFDVLGIQGYVPDAEKVESIELSDGAVLTKDESVEQAIELHRRILDLGRVEETGLDSSVEADQYLPPFSLYITYHLTDGSEVSRYYDYAAVSNSADLVGQEVASLCAAYAKLESSYEARMSLARPYLEAAPGNVSVYVSGDQVNTMLDSNAADHFLKEVLAKDVKEHGASVVLSNWNSVDDEVAATYVELSIRDTKESTMLNLSKSKTPNSIAWLEKYTKKKLL